MPPMQAREPTYVYIHVLYCTILTPSAKLCAALLGSAQSMFWLKVVLMYKGI